MVQMEAPGHFQPQQDFGREGLRGSSAGSAGRNGLVSTKLAPMKRWSTQYFSSGK